WNFPRPEWLPATAQLFRVDASGTHDVQGTVGDTVHIQDAVHVVGIYIATSDSTLRQNLQTKLQTLLARETALQFDPGNNPADLQLLRDAAK
ncbi:MAG: hypothetical protein ACKPJJ_11545, partial [Planctomycetaceae bacterium]